MNKTTAELIFILDRSGSMAGLEEDTIGGFNAMLEKQKQQPGKAWVTTILFDHEMKTLHDRLPLEQVPPMGKEDYQVRGSTALLDALGEAISHIKAVHSCLAPQERPEKTLFVITTDGLENASRRYSAQEVRRLIEAQKETGWEFLFLGANMDALETAERFGIQKDHAVNFCSDKQGTALNYQAIGEAVSEVRACRPLSASWKREIDRDYGARHRK